MNEGKLFKYYSESGLENHGFIWGSDFSEICVLHIHGSYGNFYQNDFLSSFARIFSSYGITLCSINMTSHDCIAEGIYKNDEMEYVGGGISCFDTCIGDICGALSKLKTIFPRVLLQGHSLGCDRVIDFCLKTNYKDLAIILGPCDSYKLQEKWKSDESLSDQLHRIQSTFDDDAWLSQDEYGVNCGPNWTYSLPIRKKAFESIVTGAPFELFNMDQKLKYYINSDVFVYLGLTDPLRTFTMSTFAEFISDRTISCNIYEGKGGHMMEGCEDMVAKEICIWIQQRSVKI